MAEAIKDPPAWAEARFLADCAAAGLTANKSSIDRFGWDYLVEFQRPPVAGVTHDEQRGAESCRVQVKSKIGGTRSVSIKLTNALHFTRQSDPCFIVLYQLGRDGAGAREYVREFDEELMATALKRARVAHRDGEGDLHRIRVTIPFSATDERTGRVAQAVREAVEVKPAEHREAKRRLSETLGFEGGGMKATIRFAASDMAAFAEHALGLGTEFRPTDVTVTRERFEIASATPIIAGMPDRFEMRVEPTPAILDVVGGNGWRAEFAGNFRNLGLRMPGGTMASFVSRFVKAVLEERGRLRINYSHDSSDAAPLDELRAITGLHLASRSDMVVGLTVAGSDRLQTKAMRLDMGDEPWMDWFASAVGLLTSLSRPADDPTLSLDDLAVNAPAATRFCDLLTDGEVSVVTDPLGSDAPDIKCRNLVGHAHLTVGDSTFTAIVRRPCLSQDIDAAGTELRFGDPVILESAARRGGADEHFPRLRRRFLELASRVGAGLLLIDDGDLMAGDEIVTYQP